MSCCRTVDLIWLAAAVNASFRSSNMNCGIMSCLKDVRHLRFNPIVIWYLLFFVLLGSLLLKVLSNASWKLVEIAHYIVMHVILFGKR
jgi:hypothetical protein